MNNERTVTLYHGTTPESAALLLERGWEPNKFASGGNCGQPRYLYLSTGYEDALWFAQEKGCEEVLELRDIPLRFLRVDPEDGTYDTVAEEIDNTVNFPGKLVLWKAIGPENFAVAVKPGPQTESPKASFAP